MDYLFNSLIRRVQGGRTCTQGMTLVETLVAVSIIVAVGIVLSYTIQFFYRSNAYLLESTASLDSARRGIRDSILNIREASYGDDGAFPIATAATSTITFYANVDSDSPVERIRYYLSGTTLYRGVTNSAGNPPSYTGQPETITTIATYVRNASTTPLFSYYDSTGAVLPTPVDTSQIASVAITAQIDLNPTRAPSIFTLSETATLRNLRAQ